MTQMMFYERPVALNRDRHKALRLAASDGHFAFAARTNALPISSGEFAEAARDYPIVFVGEEGGPFNVGSTSPTRPWARRALCIRPATAGAG